MGTINLSDDLSDKLRIMKILLKKKTIEELLTQLLEESETWKRGKTLK